MRQAWGGAQRRGSVRKRSPAEGFFLRQEQGRTETCLSGFRRCRAEGGAESRRNGRERAAEGTLNPFRRPPYRRPPGFAPFDRSGAGVGTSGGSRRISGDSWRQPGKRVGARRTAGEHRERIGKSRGRAARSLKTSGTTPGFPPGGISAGTTPGNAARVAGTWPGQRRGKSAGGRARRRGQVLLPPELPA